MANEYQWIETLGEGAFGKVTKNKCAQNQPFRHQHPIVAVKIIKETNDSALNEVEVLKRVDHSGITKYLNSFYDANTGALTIIMEYCDKGTLTKNIGTLPKEENMVWRFVGHLALAMKYLHTRGTPIIHRDLKPDNILLKNEGEGLVYKVGDFGIAKLTSPSSLNRFYAQTCIGTEIYMAPEALRCAEDPRMHYGTPADIWSLGAVVSFYCNNGIHLFKSANDVMQWPGGKSSLPRHYSIGLRQLTADMMSPQANSRPNAKKVQDETFKDNRTE